MKYLKSNSTDKVYELLEPSLKVQNTHGEHLIVPTDYLYQITEREYQVAREEELGLIINGHRVEVDPCNRTIKIGNHVIPFRTMEAIRTLDNMNVPISGILDNKVMIDDSLEMNKSLFRRLYEYMENTI